MQMFAHRIPCSTRRTRPIGLRLSSPQHSHFRGAIGEMHRETPASRIWPCSLRSIAAIALGLYRRFDSVTASQLRLYPFKFSALRITGYQTRMAQSLNHASLSSKMISLTYFRNPSTAASNFCGWSYMMKCRESSTFTSFTFGIGL
jgi:hypothetical protein